MAIVLTMLMLTMGLSQAASVSTYSNGQSQAIVELDDSSNYFDSTSGSILLPEGETVNGAAMVIGTDYFCLLYTSPSPRDGLLSRMPSSA